MRLFKRNEIRADTEEGEEKKDELSFKSLLSVRSEEINISREEILQIPAVKSCINLIAGTVCSLPIRMYKQLEGETEEIKKDARLRLLNTDTGDTLSVPQFWKAIIEDYFLGKGGYAYISKSLSMPTSLHYVPCDQISIFKNTDPIFKTYNIMVNGKRYDDFEFFKILRRTKDGMVSETLSTDSKLALAVAYQEFVYEHALVKKGGNKKGFLLSPKKLAEGALRELKAAFRKLYGNSEENVVILQDGMSFKESSNSSVEMQLNENKETNAGEICGIFTVPTRMVKGNPSKEDIEAFIEFCIRPLLTEIEKELNRVFLLENEKEDYYFAFDLKELTKGNIKDRYAAYEIALRSNFMQIDEVRDREDLPALGINWITLGLDSVLYNPDTKEVYTPNTNKAVSIDHLKGGETNESGSES